MATTIAMRITDGMDGQSWITEDGRQLVDVLRAEAVRVTSEGDLTRYEMEDGSTVVTSEGAWDLGIPGAECYCWAGAGHEEGCAAA